MISFNMLMDTLFTKTSFFSQFSKETMRFFHNFQKKRHNFSQLVWYRTLSQFWKKNAAFIYEHNRGMLRLVSFTNTVARFTKELDKTISLLS